MPNSHVHECKDQLIVGDFLATIASSILPQVENLSASTLVWLALSILFSSLSTTRLLFLRRQFMAITKGEKSKVDYVDHAWSLHDQLIAIDEVVPESEVILNVVGGLGSEYEFLKISITTRFDAKMVFLDLCAILIDGLRNWV